MVLKNEYMKPRAMTPKNEREDKRGHDITHIGDILDMGSGIVEQRTYINEINITMEVP